MLTDYIPEDYKGAVQSDGLVNYEILETDLYPDTLHLTCWQHCKRDFLDITGNADAAKIVQTINKLYREERKIKPEWPPEKRLGQGDAGTGTFAGVDWATGSYFLKLSMDDKGGADYKVISTTQMLPVPYALYAEKAGTVVNGGEWRREWKCQ